MRVRDDHWVPPNQEMRGLVQRVANAPQFRKSPRLREFLLFACDRALQDRQDELREQSIGCAIFGRRPDYNPSEDNIVRVEARKLRMRLDEYFTSEGRDEPVLIEIPKGSYVPVFTPRTAATTDSPRVPAPPAAHSESTAARWRYRIWVQPTIIVLLVFTCLWLWNRERGRTTSAVPVPAPRNVLWSIDEQHDTTVVCGDSTLVLLEKATRTSLSLEDYLNPDYPARLSSVKAVDGSALLIANKQYTSMADLSLVAKIMQLNQSFWGRTSIRSARAMRLSDFKAGNFVLLGSKRAIPWVELFDHQLNFSFEFDERRQVPIIRNRAPRGGEQSEYVNGKVGEPGDAFSFIAFVPNLTYTGHVVIIAGSTMEGTEASGEYLLNPAFSSRLLQMVGFQPKSKPRSFEVLLRSSTMAGSWKNSEILAYRIGREYDIRP